VTSVGTRPTYWQSEHWQTQFGHSATAQGQRLDGLTRLITELQQSSPAEDDHDLVPPYQRLGSATKVDSTGTGSLQFGSGFRGNDFRPTYIQAKPRAYRLQSASICWNLQVAFVQFLQVHPCVGTQPLFTVFPTKEMNKLRLAFRLAKSAPVAWRLT